MLTLLLMALIAGSLSDSLDRGVSEALARERAAFSAVRYDLAFTLPVNRQQPVEGTLRLSVTLAAAGRIVIDFSAPKERVHSVRVGDAAVVPVYTEDHIVIPAEATRAGENLV
jgi:hypothetical protein